MIKHEVAGCGCLLHFGAPCISSSSLLSTGLIRPLRRWLLTLVNRWKTSEQSFLYLLKQLSSQEDSDKPLWPLASSEKSVPTLLLRLRSSGQFRSQGTKGSQLLPQSHGGVFQYSSFMQMQSVNFEDNFVCYATSNDTMLSPRDGHIDD